MALPQPDVVGILNRRGCLPVVGWRRPGGGEGGADTFTTAAAATRHNFSLALAFLPSAFRLTLFLPLCVHSLRPPSHTFKIVSNNAVEERVHVRARVHDELRGGRGPSGLQSDCATKQLKKNKPKVNEEFLHSNKVPTHVLGVWSWDLGGSISRFPNTG